MKSVGAVGNHEGRDISHDRLCLNVEISEHFIRAPASKETDDVTVDLGA